MKHTFFGNRLFVGLLALTSAAVAWAQPPVITTGPNLGTWTIGGVTLTLGATGGNGTSAWSLVSGALPTGVALRTDVPTAGTPATLAGVATVPGNYRTAIRHQRGCRSWVADHGKNGPQLRVVRR